MRKLMIWNLMTLDGYFEGTRPWDLDFHNRVWDQELEAFSLEQAEQIDTLLFGRRTYEGMAAYWSQEEGKVAEFMNRVEKRVASRTIETVTWHNAQLIGRDLPAEIARLKQMPGKTIAVFGSADLAATLLRERLVDEYRICLVPVVLGAGNPLFKASSEPLTMRLLEARVLQTGGVIHCYEPEYDS
jgi:dihydrofolate reductase